MDASGSPPEDQVAVDDLYKQAESRFKVRIPPAYQDAEKDKDGPDEHAQGSIVYKRKYADYLVWHQLLSHAKSAQSKSVVLVTDDGKDDWWWKVESDGPKTVGPRPELVEEDRTAGGINYLMYNPEGFLKFAKEFLKAPVSEETLKEVRDVSTTRLLRDASFRETPAKSHNARSRLFSCGSRAASTRFTRTALGFPDFVAERDGKTFGFEVKVVSQPRMVIHRLRETVYRGYYEIKEGRLNEVTIVWIVGSRLEAEELKQALYRAPIDQMPDTLRMIIGTSVDPESGEGGFFPFEEFSYKEANPSLFQRTTFGGR